MVIIPGLITLFWKIYIWIYILIDKNKYFLFFELARPGCRVRHPPPYVRMCPDFCNPLPPSPLAFLDWNKLSLFWCILVGRISAKFLQNHVCGHKYVGTSMNIRNGGICEIKLNWKNKKLAKFQNVKRLCLKVLITKHHVKVDNCIGNIECSNLIYFKTKSIDVKVLRLFQPILHLAITFIGISQRQSASHVITKKINWETRCSMRQIFFDKTQHFFEALSCIPDKRRGLVHIWNGTLINCICCLNKYCSV